MKSDRNWQKYLSLDQRKYAGQVVVIAAGKLIGSGKEKQVQRLLALARKQYPGEIPLIGQIRDPKKLYVYKAERVTRSATFKFTRVLTPVGFSYLPIAEVEIRFGGRSVRMEMTVDSGARVLF